MLRHTLKSSVVHFRSRQHLGPYPISTDTNREVSVDFTGDWVGMQ